MKHSAFTVQPRAGDVIRGDVRRPEGSSATGSGIDSAVVVVHGFKGFKDWGFFPHAASRLADAGHTVVTFNFSRNGVGEGLQNFSELETFATNTLTLELEELRLILDQVFDGTLLGTPPQRVGLLGHSRGGGTSVIAAAEDGRVASLVTWAAISSFDRWNEETKEKWRRDGRIWIPNARTKQEMPLNVTLLSDFEEHRDRLDILGAAARLEAPWLFALDRKPAPTLGHEVEHHRVRDRGHVHPPLPAQFGDRIEDPAHAHEVEDLGERIARAPERGVWNGQAGRRVDLVHGLHFGGGRAWLQV